ncbi:uncharacterized protein A4U43_C07F23030 [Asparagus officinalis]|uniref:Uncharacterized protein n=1 Tax=Asparagus officinalis TaxID=4686 RepID=A0A5P1EH78_ASPOF|nr:uncharacterized protein A4U43_C07F23030 [Asparagus officinalis]
MEKKKEDTDQNQQPSASNQNQSQTAVRKRNRLTGIFGRHSHHQQQEPPSDNPRPTAAQDPLENVKIRRGKRSSTTNTARFPSHVQHATSTTATKDHHQITPTLKSLKTSNADNTDDQKTSCPRYGFEFNSQRVDENGRITSGYAKFIREEFPAKLKSFMAKVPGRRYKEQDANTVKNSQPPSKKDKKKKDEEEKELEDFYQDFGFF